MNMSSRSLKIMKKGAWPRSRNLLFKFGILISRERLKIQTSNFARELAVRDTKTKKMKNWSKGGVARSRDLLFKFWGPLISLERLKIQTSNFARGLIVRDT